ncbi:hypothetical protein B0H12DRAFT_1120848 [Mycena haematopus]|nr:hypothetical protein B0H12DRAFT_1120848 [Mycena haematopus]
MGGGGGTGGMGGIAICIAPTGESFLRSFLLIFVFFLIILLVLMDWSLRLCMMFVFLLVILLVAMDWSLLFFLVIFVVFAHWLYEPYFPSRNFFPESLQ